jgi:hypothetical protein
MDLDNNLKDLKAYLENIGSKQLPSDKTIKLTRTEKWTKGKPEIPAWLSAFLVIYAETIIRLIVEYNKNENIAKQFGFSNANEHANFYVNPKSAQTIDTQNSLDHKESAAKPLSLENISSIKEMFPIPADKVSFVKDCVDIWIKKIMLNDFKIYKLPIDYDYEKGFELLKPQLERPEGAFLIRVVLPCLVEYQKTPKMLMNEAINGNLDSFSDLLKIDKTALNIPELRTIWEKESRTANNPKFKKLIKALEHSSYKNVSVTKIKILIAAVIQFIFAFFEYKITSEEIKKLFDAYATDTKGDTIDTDLQEGDEAFSKAVNRQRKTIAEIIGIV